MAYEVFTNAWAEAWADQLRASEAYRTAARNWQGSICLEAVGDAPSAVFVDLQNGDCHAARAASTEDLESADYVLSTGLDTWRSVLDGELDPLFGLMTGKLRLRRGHIAGLMPYVQASKEMVAAAGRVDTIFP